MAKVRPEAGSDGDTDCDANTGLIAAEAFDVTHWLTPYVGMNRCAWTHGIKLLENTSPSNAK